MKPIDLIPMTQHPRVFESTFAFASHIHDLLNEICKKIQKNNAQYSVLKNPFYNSLYNITLTNRYVTGLKNAMFDNYSYFARNLRYVTLLM